MDGLSNSDVALLSQNDNMAKRDEQSVPYKEFLNLIHYQTSDNYMERSAEIKYMHDMYGKT